ncbi:MAG: 30S ribosomal protein S1 [Terriglobia bacterium]
MSLEETPSTSLDAGSKEDRPLDSTELSPTQTEVVEIPRSAQESVAELGSGPTESAEISHLLDSMETISGFSPGEIVQATVVKLTDTEVMVDVGLKCEGAILRAEFARDDGQVTIQPGDRIPVWIENYNEKEGTVTVSYQKAARRKAWEEIEHAVAEGTTLRGRVVARIKGGLTVDIGIPAFLPGSQADVRAHADLDSLVGQEIPCKVIKLNRKRSNAVVSRRAALEEEANRRKARLMEELREGAVLEGRVKNLTDYGVFVDLGGMDGLLHITDLAWGRVAHPSEVVKPGQEIKVKVLRFDAEKGRVSLGLKQLSPDPWDHASTMYHPKDRVTGRVVGIVDYGIFVELEPGVEGLVHASELSWSKRLKHPSKVVKIGDRVEVAVLEVSSEQRRISLSMKHALPDPWATLTERLQVGATVEGKVRNLTEFGAFVEIEDGVDGLIHLSNLSWARDIKHPSEVLKKGQKVEVAILGIDPQKRRISLGLKQLQTDVWADFFAKTKVSDIVRGEVSRVASFGAFVEIEDGIEGLCHTSEIVGEQSDGSRKLEVGREYDFRILRLNSTERKIGLTMRGVEQRSPAQESNKVDMPAEVMPPAAAEDPKPPVHLEKAEAASTAG